MQYIKTSCLVIFLALFAGVCPAFAGGDGVVLDTPELMVVRHGTNESCMLPGQGYRDFTVTEDSAEFFLEGIQLAQGSSRIIGRGISRVRWLPVEDATKVEISFKSPPTSSIINSVQGTELRPYTPQVVIGFGFTPEDTETQRAAPRLGARSVADDRPETAGSYKLPKLPEAKYSDALVTLNVRNADFREVLWFLSDVGQVSIVLDPYWADEPTGSRRPVGAGADPGGGGDGGGGGPGFRPGGEFFPGFITEGIGNLSLNFKDVPFDTALDLVVMSAGLVKVDIWPGDLS